AAAVASRLRIVRRASKLLPWHVGEGLLAAPLFGPACVSRLGGARLRALDRFLDHLRCRRSRLARRRNRRRRADRGAGCGLRPCRRDAAHDTGERADQHCSFTRVHGLLPCSLTLAFWDRPRAGFPAWSRRRRQAWGWASA